MCFGTLLIRAARWEQWLVYCVGRLGQDCFQQVVLYALTKNVGWVLISSRN